MPSPKHPNQGFKKSPTALPERRHLPPLRPSRYGKKRASVLGLVYLLMAIHLIHWKLAGRTLAPLELNEVMHTLELGVVTAGFLFMAAACLSVLIFGRFFCSWGCHILALEDLCAWLLKKLHIRPRPLRSRLLLWVAPLTMAYMFIWPQMKRVTVSLWPDAASFLGAPAVFKLRILGEHSGWPSFVTTNFGRNMPGPGIAVFTFLLCGFAIVYFLGSRSFCTYACPYGTIFGFLDRFAPGRIRLTGTCIKCGRCTAVCESHLPVQQESTRFGQVVNSRCLKDLDCVSVCPTEALTFGFTRPPALLSIKKSQRPKPRYDLSRKEELLAGGVFLVTLLVYRDLYWRIPFLATLGLGCILAFCAVLGLRLLRNKSVRFQKTTLKQGGRLTARGNLAAVSILLLILLTVHSGMLRYHEFSGQRAFAAIKTTLDEGHQPKAASIKLAREHLEWCHGMGFYRSFELEGMLADLCALEGDDAGAIQHLEAVLEEHPEDQQRRLQLAESLGNLARFPEAVATFHTVLAKLDRKPETALLRGQIHFNMGVLLAAAGKPLEALQHYREALKENPKDGEIHNNLGQLLMLMNRRQEAATELKAAIAQNKNDPRARFNLGRLLLLEGQRKQAERLLQSAAALDSRFAPPARALLAGQPDPLNKSLPARNP